MNVLIIAIAAVLLVLGLGLLIFWLMRKSQQDVPDVADARAARQPQVVGTDEQGRDILDRDEPEARPRDDSAFEGLLQDEIHDLGMKPPADEEGSSRDA